MLAGAVTVVVGFAMLSAAAAVICAGGFVMAAAVALAALQDRRPKAPE